MIPTLDLWISSLLGLSPMFIGVSGFFPETTWRLNPCCQAAHQMLVLFFVLVWTAWRRWAPARRRDTVCVFLLVGLLIVILCMMLCV